MRKERVLLIDDQEIRYGGGVGPLMEILEGIGYDVEWKENPDAGIAAALNHTFDIVLIDYRFDNADKNGAQIAREISGKLPLLPLILISGYAREVETFDDCVGSGIHAVLEKQEESADVDESASRLIKAIKKAKEAVAAKTPVYDENFLEESAERFDAIEAACRGNAGVWDRLTIVEIVEAATSIAGVSESNESEEWKAWIVELKSRSAQPLNLVHVQDVLESAKAVLKPTEQQMAELENTCRGIAIRKAKTIKEKQNKPFMTQEQIFEAADRVWISGRNELTAQDAKDLWVKRKKGTDLKKLEEEIADRWEIDAKRAEAERGRESCDRVRWYQFLAVTDKGAVSKLGVVARVLLETNPNRWEQMRKNVNNAKKLMKHYRLD